MTYAGTIHTHQNAANENLNLTHSKQMEFKNWMFRVIIMLLPRYILSASLFYVCVCALLLCASFYVPSNKIWIICSLRSPIGWNFALHMPKFAHEMSWNYFARTHEKGVGTWIMAQYIASVAEPKPDPLRISIFFMSLNESWISRLTFSAFHFG